MSTTETEAGIYERLGVRRVINGRGYSTKLGGCALPREVIEAMAWAAKSCVRIEDLQQAASRVIARMTGAEAGIVTSGASAALTLAAAAVIARLDVSLMNRLPDTSGMKNEIVVHRSHRNDYDHALLLAGAKFVEVGYGYCTFSYEVERAITERTAALFYLAGSNNGVLPLQEFTAIAHRHNIPVIVDAAAELPPPGNLRAFIEAGADLVAFSGGKHIQGPQSTGILCGRKDLILSATLQQQDMDVFPETWPRRELIRQGILAGPPHHGIGRGFKVGKEEIVGLLTALELYAQRDFQSELQQWKEDMELVVEQMGGIPGVSARIVFPQPNGRPVPTAQVTIDTQARGLDAHAVINALQEGDPPICVFEQLAKMGTIIIMPEALQPGEATIIATRLRQILTDHL